MIAQLTIKQKNKVTVSLLLLAAACMLVMNCTGPPADKEADLEAGFQTPPESAKPRVWWHWMNGNISKEGIQADLQWMKRVGIGGFQNFDAGLNTPQVVEQRLIFMTPEWKDAFRTAGTGPDYESVSKLNQIN